MKRIIFLMLLFLGGCDILTTRTPQTPDSASNGFLTPTTPDILLTDLVASFSDANVENYISCFVDQTFLSRAFKFTPTASAFQSYPAFADWTLDGEKQYFTKLKSIITDNTTMSLALTNEVYTPQGDSSQISADYKLTFSSKDSGFPSEYQGSLQFKMLLDKRNHWVIVEWLDIKKESYHSWSELKGRLY